MYRGIFATCVAVAALTGCHPTYPAPAREEVLSAKTRVFPSSSRDAVLVAAERVLKAQRPDFTFLYEPDRTTAVDHGTGIVWPWTVTWKVTAEQNGSDVRAVAFVQVETTQGIDDPTPPPAYRMFFDRVEYVLGQRSEWPSCAKVEGAPGYDFRDKRVSVLGACSNGDAMPERLSTPHPARDVATATPPPGMPKIEAKKGNGAATTTKSLPQENDQKSQVAAISPPPPQEIEQFFAGWEMEITLLQMAASVRDDDYMWTEIGNKKRSSAASYKAQLSRLKPISAKAALKEYYVFLLTVLDMTRAGPSETKAEYRARQADNMRRLTELANKVRVEME